jgi:hypothetical protein
MEIFRRSAEDFSLALSPGTEISSNARPGMTCANLLAEEEIGDIIGGIKEFFSSAGC